MFNILLRFVICVLIWFRKITRLVHLRLINVDQDCDWYSPWGVQTSIRRPSSGRGCCCYKQSKCCLSTTVQNSPTCFRLARNSSRISLTIYHRSWHMLHLSSRMSSSNILNVLLRTWKMYCCGGSRTELSTPISLRWHWITCLYQVCIHYYYHSVLNLTIPTATSIDVEHVFSKGRIVLSHVWNGLSVQSTRALLCLGAWS